MKGKIDTARRISSCSVVPFPLFTEHPNLPRYVPVAFVVLLRNDFPRWLIPASFATYYRSGQSFPFQRWWQLEYVVFVLVYVCTLRSANWSFPSIGTLHPPTAPSWLKSERSAEMRTSPRLEVCYHQKVRYIFPSSIEGWSCSSFELNAYKYSTSIRDSTWLGAQNTSATFLNIASYQLPPHIGTNRYLEKGAHINILFEFQRRLDVYGLENSLAV